MSVPGPSRGSKFFTARDYVEGMWLMLQQPTPEDFVLATGETHAVREFVEKAFATLSVEIRCVALLILYHTPLPNPLSSSPAGKGMARKRKGLTPNRARSW